jgi:uncharacterized protein
MSGVDRNTGKPVSGWEHTQLCIQDLATTEIGTRVGRRDYGCNLPDLQDRPGTAAWIGRATVALSGALTKWEKRFKLVSSKLVKAGPDGAFAIAMTGDYYPRGHLGDFSIVETGKSITVRLNG